MINITFQLGTEFISIKIEGNSLFFMDANSGQVTTLEGLNINKPGVLKEFPDLENEVEWRKIAIERLKEYMRKIESEKEKMNYIIGELSKWGYKPLFYQVAGFRVKKINEK